MTAQKDTPTRRRLRRIGRALKRIGVGTFKGGVAKTTTAMMLALAATLAGLRVMLVCTDTNNRGASKWINDAKDAGYPIPFTFVQYKREDGQLDFFLEKLERDNPDIDLIIADLGGDHATSIVQTAAWAEWLISPIDPEEGGLSGVDDTYKTAAAISRLREKSGDPLYHSYLLVCVAAVGKGQAATARVEIEDDRRDEHGQPGKPRWSIGGHVLATEIARHRNYARLWNKMPTLADEETGRAELADYANLWDEMESGWAQIHNSTDTEDHASTNEEAGTH